MEGSKTDPKYLRESLLNLDTSCLSELNNKEHTSVFEDILAFLHKERRIKNLKAGDTVPGSEKSGEERQNELIGKLKPIDVAILSNDRDTFNAAFTSFKNGIECAVSNDRENHSDELQNTHFYQQFGLAMVPRRDHTGRRSKSSFTEDVLANLTIR
jgi:hypothetical protein